MKVITHPHESGLFVVVDADGDELALLKSLTAYEAVHAVAAWQSDKAAKLSAEAAELDAEAGAAAAKASKKGTR